MANKMLIDAAHPEETRVVVVRGNRVEEFDFEAANRKQLRGNIYLAKVTRVEPSLQAAFVEYGGNRHGFLAFSEIHPDYYQIPVADRQALLEAEAAERANDDAGDADEKPKRRRRSQPAKNETRDDVVTGDVEDGTDQDATEASGTPDSPEDTGGGNQTDTEPADTGSGEDGDNEASADEDGAEDDVDVEAGSEARDSRSRPRRNRRTRSRRKPDDEDEDADADGDDHVESVGAEDAMEEVPERRQVLRRQYKIQEVIKRRQVILVQVVKEERGNKGAALTTYLSLAGRYSVLMPNTARGGGISRKITQPTDRKRLKNIASELDVPEGMGVILRTAGASRTKAEIKRDFEYLMRLWENVRELTLQSSAPSLVYEEGSLIKRSIRDLYNKDINQVLVAGDEGYREAKDFMRMLMPSHAKNVQPYRDPSPLFIRNGVEPQLDAMFSPQVTLKSGGYIVINQTEALVSIDVNSGKSTREHNIEDTALQTNLEAAEEVARQLRLRDLAGLVVIDFIDMEENKNNRNVERKLKECLKNDRARIQVGRISHFGLLEMSRQRLRTGVLESSTTPCPHCNGTGMIRSVESVALHVLRSIEDNLLKGATHNLVIRTNATVALYILNQKRPHLSDLERRFAVGISIEAGELANGQLYALERADPVDRERFPAPELPTIQIDTIDPEDEDEQPDIVEQEDLETEDRTEDRAEDRANDRKRRRRRKRRRQEDSDQSPAPAHGSGDETIGDDEVEKAADSAEGPESDEDRAGDDERRRKRRRGRRGGRRGRRDGDMTDTTSAETAGASSGEEADDANATQPDAEADQGSADQETPEEGNAPVAADLQPANAATETGQTSAEDPASAPESVSPDDTGADTVAAETAPLETAADGGDAPADIGTVQPAASEAGTETGETAQPEKPSAPAEPVLTSQTSEGEEDTPKPKRGGWWQRRSFF
ncbi:ribonuclease E [Roseibium aquae]|uniref:Ribonuclease E n=1 Tax=Roseibium aquae TaxID=1323746 RepID=A0A916TG96_9HYPH|nr:Rne/Rng family ribonuclease [Roseibium aquae]GGB44210.1 ribonuclease E [Roseibium aquae]